MFLVERGVRLRGKRFQVLNYAVAGLDRRFFFLSGSINISTISTIIVSSRSSL